MPLPLLHCRTFAPAPLYLARSGARDAAMREDHLYCWILPIENSLAFVNTAACGFAARYHEQQLWGVHGHGGSPELQAFPRLWQVSKCEHLIF